MLFDLHGRIEGNAQSLYHIMKIGHVSVQYKLILLSDGHLLEFRIEQTRQLVHSEIAF